MDNEKKWYYVEYNTFGLPDEIEALSADEAEEIAMQHVIDFGVDITAEEMED